MPFYIFYKFRKGVDIMSGYKKQHYVPRLYLKGFTTEEDNERINVYDKSRRMFRKNQQLMNVGSQNHFYDFKLEDIYNNCSKENKKKFHEYFGKDATPKSVKDEHLLEKFLGEVVEKPYDKFLAKIKVKIEKAKENSWYLENCMALSNDDKKEFAYYLSVQFLRGKYFTNSFKVFCEKAMGIKVSDDSVKVQQAKTLVYHGYTNLISDAILKHDWVIYINKTEFDLYVSDNPFIFQSHTYNEDMPCNFLSSSGIEVVFPITKSSILVIYGKDTYGIMQKLHGKHIYSDNTYPIDRRFKEIKQLKQVEYYNTLQVAYSINDIYLSDESDRFIDTLLEKHPEYLKKEYFAHK